MKRMKAALVCVTFNDFETIEKFVRMAKELRYIGYIVIVDNNSSDKTVEQLQALNLPDKIIILESAVNGGYSAGNNIGIKYAIDQLKVDYLFIANPDIIITDETVNALLDILGRRTDVGIVSCRVMEKDNIFDNSVWKFPSFWYCILYNLNLSKIFGGLIYYPDAHFLKQLVQVDVISGSFFAGKAKMFQEIDYLDENTFLYCEEDILAQRIKSKGYVNLLRTDCSYVHNHSVSIKKNLRKHFTRMKIYENSRIYYCKKYLHIGRVKQVLLWVSFYFGLIIHFVSSELKKVRNFFLKIKQ